ncbi:MAG: methyltransferase domain-containing protein [Candidatus Hydrogenedentales bacterium]|jgi:ubiquinone/menaquinone biosynthesis C-methylase UbiE
MLDDHEHESYRRFHERRHGMLLDLLNCHAQPRQKRCLDIGGGGDVAGAGAVIRERYAEELHAVDLGDDVEKGRQRGAISVPCNVDWERLPYEDSFFDLVLFASVVEHLYNPHTVLREIARVLRPGGLLVLEAPNAVALGRRLDALMGRNPFRWFNQYNAVENKSLMIYCAVFYTPEEIEAALAPEFEVIEHRYCMHAPSVNPCKRWLREAAFRLNPRLGDCFFVVARRKE